MATLIPLLFAASLFAQDKVSLEWKFKKGDTFRYVNTQRFTGDMGGMQFTQEGRDGMRYEIIEVSDKGEATIKATWDSVKVKITGGMDTDYDSEKDKEPPKDEPMAKAVAAMVGKSFTFKINSQGEALQVSGADKILKDVLEKSGEDEDSQIGKAFKQELNDDQMKRSITQMFAVLPKNPAAKGDAWNSELTSSLPMAGKCTLANKMVLKELRDSNKEAVITQETKIKQAAKGKDDEEQTFELGDSESKSEIVWDIAEGRMKATKSVMTMKLSAGGQEMDAKIQTETTLTPVAKEETKPQPKEKKDY